MSSEPERFEARLAGWLVGIGVDGPRRVVRATGGRVLVSKFEEGFAARLYAALDRVPELTDGATVHGRYAAAALKPGKSRVALWRETVDALTRELAPQRGLDERQLSEIRAGTDSVAALLDSVLWSGPVTGSEWAPSPGEAAAYEEALARMDADDGIFTRYYGTFEGLRVENHCPGAPIARALFTQSWQTITQ
jgi:hypothetical protein